MKLVRISFSCYSQVCNKRTQKLDLLKEHCVILTRKNKQTYKKVHNKQRCWQFDFNLVQYFSTCLAYEKTKNNGENYLKNKQVGKIQISKQTSWKKCKHCRTKLQT